MLKSNWGQLSAAALAEKIGGVSRNAVIGKAHRLNLQARATSKKLTPKANAENNNTSEIKHQKLGRKAKFKALLLDPQINYKRRTRVMDLCRDWKCYTNPIL